MVRLVGGGTGLVENQTWPSAGTAARKTRMFPQAATRNPAAPRGLCCPTRSRKRLEPPLKNGSWIGRFVERVRKVALGCRRSIFDTILATYANLSRPSKDSPSVINIDSAIVDAAAFYDHHYAGTEPLFLRPGEMIVLGDKQNRTCRFCGRSEPEVTFKQEAHAIPESLGNKSLTNNYECDACNQAFGKGIENDLGNWSKPMRTFARIRGKTGIPTLKKGGLGPGWRIEYGPSGFVITQYEEDPVFEVNEEQKEVRFNLKRDAYTPIAVLKAFVKIGLTILPAAELPNFSEALAWIQQPDHTMGLVKEFPVIRTFQPGPMPNDLIVVMLMRRRANVSGVPYAFLILSYGNEVFQVFLPSPKQDVAIHGQKLTFPPFPVPGGPDPARYGKASVAILDLTGRELIKGETVSVVIGFDQMALANASGAAAKYPGLA